MANYTLIPGEITGFMETNLLLVFGHPMLLALFLMAIVVVYGFYLGLGREAMGVSVISGILIFAWAGLIPEWVGFLFMMGAAALLAFTLARFGWI